MYGAQTIMAILLYRASDGQVSELPLKNGLNRLGRSELNDVRVPDPSVSTNHCELVVSDSSISVRDLGSTNGTAIDQRAIKEGTLLPGQILRVGNMELVLQGEGAPVSEIPQPIAPPAPEIPLAQEGCCKFHGTTPADWRCPKCDEIFCGKCVVDGRKFGVTGVKFCNHCTSKVNALRDELILKQKAEKTFTSEMAGAWKYPFRGNGLIIMICGTIFFVLFSLLLKFTFLLAGFLFVFSTGYYFAYAQQVITASAQGEDDLPGWPDFSDYYQDIVIPFFQGAALFLVYLLPVVILSVRLLDDSFQSELMVWGMLGISLFLMPMAWLAVSMHESVVGISPHFVIPSILRIPGHYFLVFVQLLAVVVISGLIRWFLSVAGIPIVSTLLIAFVGLYFTLVMCRMLGSMYYINRRELGWFERRSR